MRGRSDGLRSCVPEPLRAFRDIQRSSRRPCAERLTSRYYDCRLCKASAMDCARCAASRSAGHDTFTRMCIWHLLAPYVCDLYCIVCEGRGSRARGGYNTLWPPVFMLRWVARSWWRRSSQCCGQALVTERTKGTTKRSPGKAARRASHRT